MSSPRPIYRTWTHIRKNTCPPVVQANIKASGGRLIAAGQNFVALEGPSPGTRVAINEFDSLDAVRAWRSSVDYKAARKIGDKYAKFRSFAIEGIPQ